MKKCSKASLILEMQTETTMGKPPTTMANNAKTDNTSVGEDVEQLQFSHTAGFPATLAKDLVVSYKAKHTLNHKPYDTAIPLLGHLSKRCMYIQRPVHSVLYQLFLRVPKGKQS